MSSIWIKMLTRESVTGGSSSQLIVGVKLESLNFSEVAQHALVLWMLSRGYPKDLQSPRLLLYIISLKNYCCDHNDYAAHTEHPFNTLLTCISYNHGRVMIYNHIFRCHKISFETGSSRGFFLISSWGEFPHHRRHRLAH